MHELGFEDNVDAEYSPYEVAVHNFGTPVEQLLVNQMDIAPQGQYRVNLDKAIWHALSKEDQEKWDKMSKEGKEIHNNLHQEL